MITKICLRSMVNSLCSRFHRPIPDYCNIPLNHWPFHNFLIILLIWYRLERRLKHKIRTESGKKIKKLSTFCCLSQFRYASMWVWIWLGQTIFIMQGKPESVNKPAFRYLHLRSDAGCLSHSKNEDIRTQEQSEQMKAGKTMTITKN